MMNLRERCMRPTFVRDCPACDGEGAIEHPHPFRDDPYFCRVVVCEACSGAGWVDDDDPEPVGMDDRDEWENVA